MTPFPSRSSMAAPPDLASRLYSHLVEARNRMFDSGLLSSRAVPGAVVISVGNLSSGGSGKTPLAIYLVDELNRRGARAAYVSRGYRGRASSRGLVVSDGRGPRVDWQDCGDEAYLAADKLRGAPVVIGADRYSATQKAVSHGSNVVVLDDGFQHRRLARDLDIVLVSPTDIEPGRRLLPVDPLREPASSLSRAHVIGGLVEDWRGRDDSPGLLFSVEPRALVDGMGAELSGRQLEGFRAFLVTGVARPQRVRRALDRLGVQVAGERRFPDHHRFRPRELAACEREARAASACGPVTTEKDRVRIPAARCSLPVFSLAVDTRVEAGEEPLWEANLARLQERMITLSTG